MALLRRVHFWNKFLGRIKNLDFWKSYIIWKFISNLDPVEWCYVCVYHVIRLNTVGLASGSRKTVNPRKSWSSRILNPKNLNPKISRNPESRKSQSQKLGFLANFQDQYQKPWKKIGTFSAFFWSFIKKSVKISYFRKAHTKNVGESRKLSITEQETKKIDTFFWIFRFFLKIFVNFFRIYQ